MKIFLMRHGYALDGEDDEKRPLSDDGFREAELAGIFLSRIEEVPGIIYHSPLLRSRQTAEGVARALGLEKNLFEHPGLLPYDSVSSFAKKLTGRGGVLVAGHQPFISRLASFLLCESQDALFAKFTTGTLLGLYMPRGGGRCALRFHVTARMISNLLGNSR